MGLTDIGLILGVGLLAGFINTLAGGGSLLTLPALIFLDLPPTVANGTNRVAIFVQNIFGVAGFRSKGVSAYPYSLWLGLSALAGAIPGAYIAADIRGVLFNKILAVIMVIAVLFTIFGPSGVKETHERLEKRHRAIGIGLFFFIGIFGGFIQAGTGFLIMTVLRLVNHFSLVKTNSAKVLVVLIYTVAALVVFAWMGKVWWQYGAVLAIGNSTGAWVASRWSVAKGDRYVKGVLVVAVLIFAVRLWMTGG